MQQHFTIYKTTNKGNLNTSLWFLIYAKFLFSYARSQDFTSNVHVRIRETLLINSHFIVTDLQFYELVHRK